ncbi:hypothetical protein ASPFODRAFT_661130 [Aspergillus luchuensis CBS 106.47]|uniref:Uncharacterized protein n=1 Tax=Aspergillus luchuensis (strain CBS 106.47) TaxID=1137211 RepID=A0A1M3TF10_ASPLC|nr:hypothetical protein ASPFODRAFT_661130 [Aspergillus luchuensis CBS 106.47]
MTSFDRKLHLSAMSVFALAITKRIYFREAICPAFMLLFPSYVVCSETACFGTVLCHHSRKRRSFWFHFLMFCFQSYYTWEAV